MLICFLLLLFHLSFTHRLFIGESAFINSLMVRFVRLWTHAYLFFLDTLNFPFKLIKIVISTSFSKFWQILIELCRQKTSNIWGKMHFQFCYLPTAYYYRLDLKALLERKPAKISCADKVGNQTGYKKQKKGRRRVQEKKWNRFAKNSKAAIHRHPEDRGGSWISAASSLSRRACRWNQ